MFFTLKLLLIVLLNKTYARIMQDTQIIILPAWNPTGANKIPLTLKVFGQLIQLNLRRNDEIIPSAFEIWKYNTKSVTRIKKWSQLKVSDPYCFYVHEDYVSSAVINFCQEHGLEGLILLKNDILEIKPLQDNFAPLSLIDDFCVKEQINLSFGQFHLIERSRQNFYYLDNYKPKRRYIRSTQNKLIVELAVFFDEAAYRIFMPFFNNNEKKLRDMILAYVNRIQSMFNHPSFGVPLDISLIRLDIMKKQPLDLPVSNDIVKLLDSFCKYTENHNPPDDNDPHHWDVGLYITGINIYRMKDNHVKKNIGGSSYGKVCTSTCSCAIAEFGAERITFGFASSIAATHEISHVLGYSHDRGFMVSSCPDYKHVMSTQVIAAGMITWSKCSHDTSRELWKTKPCLLDHRKQENIEYALNHLRYHNLPGRQWTAKAQCELSLHDKDANVVTLHDICQVLQCETPARRKYFFTGAALDGTHCALGKECRGGECVDVLVPPYDFKYCDKDNWSEWREDDCRSDCLEKSKGVIIKRRSCKHRGHRTTSCEGAYYNVVLCDDSSYCKNNRETIDEYTTRACANFSNFLENKKNYLMYELEKKPGKRGLYDAEKPWIACTILCRRKVGDTFTYYSPYEELLRFSKDPYFPDGTWCHNKKGQDYYCRQRYCLPENYSIGG